MNRKRRNKKKIWLVSQNKKRLKHRTKQKIKHKNRKKKMQNFSKTTNYSYYDKKNQEFKFLAPEIFSIMDNPKETIEYFNDVIKKLMKSFIIN